MRGSRILAPGPGHSRDDRSLSILLTPGAPDGFTVHSHAGDDWRECRDYVKDRLGLENPHRAEYAAPPDPEVDDAKRIDQARAIWMAAAEPQGTPVEAYLASRGLPLASALRWHQQCPFAGRRTGAMIALITDIETGIGRAVHRTALSPDGRKIEVAGYDRLSLGPMGGGAVRLTPDEDVTTRLGIGEGIESTLSIQRLPGFAALPVWSLLNAGGVGSFPVLAGIETLFVAVDQDATGRNAAERVGERWTDAGREVVLLEPVQTGHNDINDVVTDDAA